MCSTAASVAACITVQEGVCVERTAATVFELMQCICVFLLGKWAHRGWPWLYY